MFFDSFAAKHELRFLDDYVDMANLSSLATEHLGMIDVIVASRGRAFAGTFYSTFSGYITRLRGYYGMSKYSTFYSWNPKKYEMQNGDFFAPSNEFNREYAIGWIAIDGDEKVFGDNVKEENIGDGKAAASGGEITADTKDTTKLIATDGANNVKNSTVRRKHRASLTLTFFLVCFYPSLIVTSPLLISCALHRFYLEEAREANVVARTVLRLHIRKGKTQ